MVGRHQIHEKQFRLIVLNCIHIAICCISLISVAALYADYHISYHPSGLFGAVVVILAFAAVSPLFAFAPVSFGYFVGFYFYTMILGYLWLDFFSEFNYNHALTGLSAAASAIAFLLPALFISSPIRQVYIPSLSAFDRLLDLHSFACDRNDRCWSNVQFQIRQHRHIYAFAKSSRFQRS